jgi:hypothetical protein
MLSTSPRTAKLGAAIALLTLAALAAAEPARGGSYGAAVCNPDLGAWHADAAFTRSSPHYGSGADCGGGGEGLSIDNEADSTPAGAWGAWTVRAPAGTDIERLNVSAVGSPAGGHAPELATAAPGGALAPFATPDGTLRRFAWDGSGAGEFAARLRCRRASGCGRGRNAGVRVKRIALRLADRVAPTVQVAGGLFDRGSRRGAQLVEPSASDVGGGVRRFLLQVNGHPVTSHTVACRLSGRIGLRLQPCPSDAGASFIAATAAPPFRQGPNRVLICAADYADTTAANRACAERRVRVDNLCPTSSIASGATLAARLRRAPGRATVTGRLLDSGGAGVAGATVCVAARARIESAAERVIATPITTDAGRFRARIAAGPSRELRVAYWPDDAAALERYLDLRVRAHPRLEVSPSHPIRNGNRARFRVRLPGPANAERRLRIQARSGRRWLELRSGRTNDRGVYRARYRFHATTGRRRYAFRALVPRQAGYPYDAGRSRVRHVTVVG